MAYCERCGKKLADGAAFCSGCGSPVPQEDNRRAEAFDGAIHKCPSCGQAIGAFSVTCPSCGYELRDTHAATSLRELSLQLQEITSQSNKGTKQTLLERLRRDATDTDDMAAALIKAFPIPNTREDLIEFIITSASSINVDTFNEMKRGNQSSMEIAMSNAWLAKLEQAYQKASITLNGDEAFERIETIYNTTMKKVSRARHAMLRFWIILALFWAAIIALCLVLSAINPEVR